MVLQYAAPESITESNNYIRQHLSRNCSLAKCGIQYLDTYPYVINSTFLDGDGELNKNDTNLKKSELIKKFNVLVI